MIPLTPETKRALGDWAAGKPAVAALYQFHPENEGDFAIHLMPKETLFDWAYGEYITQFETWTAEISAIVGEAVQVGAYRDDISSIDPATSFDVSTVGTLIWSRS